MKAISLFHFVLCVNYIVISYAWIQNAYILPHGGIALDPNNFNTTNHTAKEEALKLNKACKLVGHNIADTDPDIVLLSTPHGVADLNNFAFYLNPTGEGEADTDNCKCPPCCYRVNVTLDCQIAKDIVEKLGKHKNITGFSGFGPPCQNDVSFPLRYEIF